MVISVEVKVVETENAYGDVIRDIEINDIELDYDLRKYLRSRISDDCKEGDTIMFYLKTDGE